VSNGRGQPPAEPGTNKPKFPKVPNDVPEQSSKDRGEIPDDVARDISNEGIQADPGAHERRLNP
jgi:hypothetical protein